MVVVRGSICEQNFAKRANVAIMTVSHKGTPVSPELPIQKMGCSAVERRTGRWGDTARRVDKEHRRVGKSGVRAASKARMM